MQESDYFEIYKHAHNNAIDLVEEARILFDKERYSRAYFLAFTALEEISKSQCAADVYTGFSQEDDFKKIFCDHKDKIQRVNWAHDDANNFPYDLVWIGPNKDDIEKVESEIPSWEKRQDALFVGFSNKEVHIPDEKISESDARGIIHIAEIALQRIWEMEEVWGHTIGTKGFMK